ncbi:L-aspartate oxidase [Clostridium botulinum]|uniref:L-aspartate oxidase n=1 Tax=Clostridium botulinum TaxID=1491 RepID=UPI0007E12FA2|nr:L-aspartate oxidase [Clostridium botulinum]APQ77550.1 pyridine nucleotide-disulfide oxidoreductase family protein [Clostridium botulinum]AUM98901.1 L-aspartate oxidase [Clostridium botulinum]AUN17517.1 L-aspartate oxidase [Clostridium botulinum]KEI80788.1 L-aspartate oxidase [Clostridium botulinum B2 331]MBN3346750.1 L-aspartate oxidase [Clostridium botulinum]
MNLYADVLIAGSGVAGLYSALNLRKDLKIVLISKGKLNECNTTLAQGGISVARNKDDITTFVEDTLKAGSYENNLCAVKILANESIENINKLQDMGLNLDKCKKELSYTKEGAHSINRIVHFKDYTGKKLEEILTKKTLKRKNITVIENCSLVDLIQNNNTCFGGICLKDNKQINIYSKVTILATGGIGGLFKNSTNEPIITGDGIAIAIKNNIKIKNLDYIQFHPTAFFKDTIKGKKFLISESVRGEGGKLLNSKGERFVNELLSRDIVTKYILEEERKTSSNNVYLDITFKPETFLKKRFPTIYENCLKNGVNICKDAIPVSPAQHYFMGGIQVDLLGQSSMNHLYAFGEVSCTGVHGKNRLASNSLLEGLVFSKRGAEKINFEINNFKLSYTKIYTLKHNVEYYSLLNKKIITKSLLKLRSDLQNELVSC